MKLLPTLYVILTAVIAEGDSVQGYTENICLYHNEHSSCPSDVLCTTYATSRNISSTLSPLTGNFTIQLCSRHLQLHNNLTIHANESQSVTIKGMLMQTQLNCEQNVGVHFFQVKGLVLENIELVSCGTTFSAPGGDFMFISSLYIINCIDVTITNLSIRSSKGNGMTMIDNGGSIRIQHSSFSGNRDIYSPLNGTKIAVGSGLRIILSFCSPRHLQDEYNCSTASDHDVSNSRYSITHCIFDSNNNGKTTHKEWSDIGNDRTFPEESEYLMEGFGRGGGLCVVVDNASSYIQIHIKHCKFINNSAVWGGGLYVAIQENSHNNTVQITNCTFLKNHCDRLAGGGAIIGYQANSNNHPQNNSISFHSCSFVKNSAGFGGGVSFYSSPSSKFPNSASFRDCNWTGNVAIIGAAVNVAPQVWVSFIFDLKIEISFRDCNFTSNYLESDGLEMELDKSYRRGRGTFSAVGYHIQFEKSIIFDNNSESAMYLTSTEIEFMSNADVAYSNNRGFDGGAIYMQGFAALILHDNLKLTFVNNTAERSGGAIFQHTYDNRDFFASQSCFVRYKGAKRDVMQRNMTLSFSNNTAGGCGRDCKILGQYGHSIYATTFTPCFNARDCPIKGSYCIAKFEFNEQNEYDLSTSGKNISWNEDTNETKIVKAVPGKLLNLPIKTLNDLGHEVLTVYHVKLESENNTKVMVENNHTYLLSKSIVLLGKPSARATLTLKTDEAKGILYNLQVVLQECPPGFVYNSHKSKCECSTLHRETRISGIQTCDNEDYEAKLISGYWISYDQRTCTDQDTFGAEKDLLYATCPRGQCINENNRSELVERLLPNDSSVCSLDEVVCADHRTGVLCSKCKPGYAAHYHDSTYSCKPDHCQWGWLLYIVSELVPTTVFFIVIIVMNIKLTNGAINGVILFFQLSDTMLIRANGLITFPSYSNTALEVYLFITRIFNLNFFAVNSLSFCIWKSASTLDLLAFKYLTILYSSALVVIIIAFLKYNNSTKLNKLIMKMKSGSAHSTKSAIIHGISGFLIICYSECTRISLLILYFARLYVSGSHDVRRIVPFYNGELEYFRGKHLLYSLPAVLTFLFCGIMPPVLFLSYPLCYKVLAVMKLSESKFSRLICIIFPLEKFKPFFDSFQSSFKDKYRFFSGLYFLYRFTTLATFYFQGELVSYYAMVQVQFLLILAAHSICQPYKVHSHNITDTLIFLNLSILNIITMFNYHLSLNSAQYQQMINTASIIQVTLLYLPLAYAICYASKKIITPAGKSIVHAVRNRFTKKAPESTEYRRFSRTFTLSAAENRLRDTLNYEPTR